MTHGASTRTFVPEISEGEKDGGKSKTVEPGNKYCLVSKIGIGPELIQQRVVEPVVMTRAV